MTSRRLPVRQTILQLTLAVAALVMLAPFTMMVLAAFNPESRVASGQIGITDLTLDNFRYAIDRVNWLHLYRTTTIVTVTIFVCQVAVCLPAGYALARSNMRHRRLLLALVLACLVVPQQVKAIPTYVALARLGFADTLTGLIVPFIGSAFGIYLFRQFILTIPQAVFDAARLDGVKARPMVWRIVLPNAWPAVLAFATFSFIAHWNDLFWPSIILRSTENATVPYGVVHFTSGDAGAQRGAQMAAATLAVAPLLVAFLLAQRHFVRGIALRVGTD